MSVMVMFQQLIEDRGKIALRFVWKMNHDVIVQVNFSADFPVGFLRCTA